MHIFSGISHCQDKPEPACTTTAKDIPPPSLFYPHTFSLPLSLPLFIPRSPRQIQKLCHHSNSCRLRKLPKSLPFFFLHRVFPVTFSGYCFDVGTHNQVEGGWKRKKKKKTRSGGVMLWGNNRAEQQSRKRRGGIKGGKAWWPDSTAREKERKKKGGWGVGG